MAASEIGVRRVRFPPEIIVVAVRWYLRFNLSYRDCFTAPTFITFQALVVGSIAQTRRRTVCGMLLGRGLERWWHHARAHRFFATARWCTDNVGLALLELIVARQLPQQHR